MNRSLTKLVARGIRILGVVVVIAGTILAGTPAFADVVGSPRVPDGNRAVRVQGTSPAEFGGNDMFANANGLVPAIGDYWWEHGTNDLCTREPGEPLHAGRVGANSVWFRWQAPADGVFTVSTLASDFDSSLAVYTGAAVNALTPVASNDNYDAYIDDSIVSFRVTAGTVYSIAVEALPAQAGHYFLEWAFSPDTAAPVWRFYNKVNSSHFYTGSPIECVLVYYRLWETYDMDGPAYGINTLNVQNGAPLYRFYNKQNGSHFYTASQSEKNDVQANLAAIYSYDGQAYKVCPTPVAGSRTVWRFYNKQNGSHFYTADASEKANVQANLSAIYQLDGPGFYLAP